MHFIINPHIYPTEIIVSVCEDDITLKKFLTRRLWERCDIEPCFNFTTPARTIFLGSNQIVMRFNKNPSAGYVAHEAVHACIFLFHEFGIEVISPAEPLAYLVDYIVEEYWRQYKKKWRGRK